MDMIQHLLLKFYPLLFLISLSLQATVYKYTINQKNVTCFYGIFAASLDYSGSIIDLKNGTTNSFSNCSEDVIFLSINYLEGNQLNFTFISNNSIKYLNKLEVKYSQNANVSHGLAIGEYFKTNKFSSYFCKRENRINVTQVTPMEIIFTDLHIDSFTNKTEFRQVYECDMDKQSEMVPIVVGIIILILFALFIVALVIFKKKGHKSQYRQM